MIQKVRRGEDRSIPTHCDHQFNVGKVLPIQIYSIDAGETDGMLAQNCQQIRDAILVRVITLFQTLPSDCLGSLASQFELCVCVR